MRSDGDVAIQLAKLAGLELDPWQQDALVLMLGRRADDSWASTECVEIVARQNGKGTILEARVLAGLFLFNEQLQMWSAHEYRTALEAFLRVRTLIDNLAEEGILGKNDVKISTTHGSEGLTLATGQRLKFIARSKSSGRGFSGDLVILDEAFALTRAQHSALLPTLSARENPQILYTSSPPLDGDSGEVFEEDFADEAGVATGAAGRDEQALLADEGLAGGEEGGLAEAVAVGVGSKSCSNGLGLLEYLAEHGVRKCFVLRKHWTIYPLYIFSYK